MTIGRRQKNFECPIRDVVDRIGDVWSLKVLLELSVSSNRFSAIFKRVDGISRRMLTVTLRRLERDGLVSRSASPSIPAHIIYALTALSKPLIAGIATLRDWASKTQPKIHAARAEFDQRLAFP